MADPASPDRAVEVSDLAKEYDRRVVLDLDAWSVEAGERFVLLGPSGSGKSTLLRILAGLVKPSRGEVKIHGASVAGVPAHKRGLGFVFQGLALWPHLTVRGNIALGLDRVVGDAEERRRRVNETAEELKIERFLGRKPGKLSGGERQRVALARSLVRRPRLLLLDEPFSDLDARLRREMARLVLDLHERHGMTTILITHDRTDAYLMADRIGVLRDGRLMAVGRPDELAARPTSAFAAEFLGDAALLSGRVDAGGRVETDLGSLAIDGNANVQAEGQVLVALRPDEIRLGEGPVTGRVVGCEFAGGPWHCRIAVGDSVVTALHDRPIAIGEAIALTPPGSPRPVLEEDR
ncbi:MAG: ABC transporter ATP-binding protein [Planctomycetota bacterium]|jgi:ABC-type Fe3+/spermidine/putrescine transport system ATPase subunit